MDFRGDDLDGLLFRQNPPRAAVYSRLSGLWPTDWPSTLLACFARQSGLYEASLITFFCLLALVQDAQILQGLDVSAVIDSPQEWTTQIRGAHVIHSADVAAGLLHNDTYVLLFVNCFSILILNVGAFVSLLFIQRWQLFGMALWMQWQQTRLPLVLSRLCLERMCFGHPEPWRLPTTLTSWFLR
eukprot:m.385026 g.385026  ORF g.385026 m.385026 type:complete len:185 (+) comp56276_c1_seq38:977-1531(+)